MTGIERGTGIASDASHQPLARLTTGIERGTGIASDASDQSLARVS
jgi:hypothetical protein